MKIVEIKLAAARSDPVKETMNPKVKESAKNMKPKVKKSTKNTTPRFGISSYLSVDSPSHREYSFKSIEKAGESEWLERPRVSKAIQIHQPSRWILNCFKVGRRIDQQITILYTKVCSVLRCSAVYCSAAG